MSEKFVPKDWISKLSQKQQDIVKYSLKGPPTSRPTSVKFVTNWLRDIALDFSQDNMKKISPPSLENFEMDLQYCTVNYYSNLMHAMEIIGYNHPEENTRDIALGYYAAMVEFLHLNPETKEELNSRLEDRV